MGANFGGCQLEEMPTWGDANLGACEHAAQVLSVVNIHRQPRYGEGLVMIISQRRRRRCVNVLPP